MPGRITVVSAFLRLYTVIWRKAAARTYPCKSDIVFPILVAVIPAPIGLRPRK